MSPHPAELLADALEALASEAARFEALAARAVNSDRPPDSVADNIYAFVALTNGTTHGMVRLARALMHEGGRAALLNIAALGFSQRNPDLLALGRNHAAGQINNR
jgi:hypothetical protein